MTPRKKLMIVIIVLSLILCVQITGTLAWLTAESGPVTNTFTYGDINITLWENTIDENGDLTAETTQTGNSYQAIPGATIQKNPTVTVTQGSEKCYVYVCIENQLLIGSDIVASINDIDATKWETVASNGNFTLYRYASEVDASLAKQDLVVFSTVTFDGEKITKQNINQLAGKEIIINAYAHQSENTTQTVAETAAKAWFDKLVSG